MLLVRPFRVWLRLRNKRFRWGTTVFIFLLVTFMLYANVDRNSFSGKASVFGSDLGIFGQSIDRNGRILRSRSSSLEDHLGQSPAESRPGKTLVSHQQCPGLRVNLTTVKANHFRVVESIQTYVYTAYRDGDKIRVVTVRRTSDPRSLYCHLWYNVTGKQDPLSVAQAKVENLPENHGQRHTAAFITCKLPLKRKDKYPIAVNVVFNKCHSVTNGALPVERLGPGEMTSTFTVCVTPLNNNYSRIHDLVEMIEFNQLLGADKIAFYNYSISPTVDKVLRYYMRRGVVEVFPWNLPTRKIHYYGQLAALNDCLHHHRHRSQYLVYQDLDEFIIPQDPITNWGELIKRRSKVRPNAATFQIRNVFFRREWPKLKADFPFNEKAKKYKSVVLQTTVKEFQVLPYNSRSKYILDPLQVSTVGIHTVWKPAGLVDHVPQHMALVCHYRNWETPNDSQRKLDDFSVVERFGRNIVVRLERAWVGLERTFGFKPEEFT